MNLDDSALRRLAWGSIGFMLVGATAGVLLDLAAGGVGDAGFALGLMSFVFVGLLIVTRRPRATLGWLMLSMAYVIALPLGSYARYAIEARGGELPFGPLALALDGPTWIPFIAISGYLLLLFPDGHLPSPRWRWFAWACGIGLGVLAVLIWVAPGNFADSGYPEVRNPLGIEALEPFISAGFVLATFAPILMLGGAVAVVLRLRRTTDDVERHQLRWLTYAACVIALLFLSAFIPGVSGSDSESWVQTLGVTSFVLIPIAIGIAVLRYRLYDIDVVIRKTAVFAVMAVVIALVYVGLVVGVGTLVGRRQSPVLSALAAAVVALVFGPARARARRLADRLVYGKRATPYEVMSTFGDQLAGTYAADDVLARTARVLGEGVGADRARVWLRVGDDLRAVAAWPDAPAASDDRDRAHDFTVEVRHQGEHLGALSVAMPPNDPMNPSKERLVQDLAAQAGLVLRNERLTSALKARLAELQAAQKRLVAAQDHERRKLERNIHDGAQQQLVALQVRQRLAAQLIDRDPVKAKGMLAELQADTATALEDLRDLARGIYPPLLADQGLAAALEAQARKSPVPVTIHADGVGRLPQDIEAAVYFSALEALQNTSKYARASRATVSLSRANGSLAFTIVDDGTGFDTSATGYGTGLQGIADRLGALDGELEVTSVPGSGTTVIGRLPVEALARDEGQGGDA